MQSKRPSEIAMLVEKTIDDIWRLTKKRKTIIPTDSIVKEVCRSNGTNVNHIKEVMDFYNLKIE